MPPLYDFKCPKCEKPFSLLLSIHTYGEMETFECEHCGAINTRDHRANVGAGLATKVIGVRKGGYNSSDWS